MDGETSSAIAFGIPLVVFLLLANAMFVAAEFALVTLRRTRIEQLAATGSRSARSVQKALGNLDYSIAAAQLGITMASIALGFFGEPVLAGFIEPPVEALVGAFAPVVAHTVAIAIAFTFVTSLHIIIGEFIPKTIALEQPERTSMLIAMPLTIFVRVFGPVIWLMNTIANGALRALGMDVRPLGEDKLTAEDLAYTLESSASGGLISRRELDLTRYLLRMSTIEVRELMVPRSEIVALAQDASREDIAATFARRPLTRYPVYERNLDEITGILDAKRLLLADEQTRDQPWQSHVLPVIAMPESVTAENALKTIRTEATPMAILVDEHGGTAGLVTQFDIMRYLATDLPDEARGNGRSRPPWGDGLPLVVSGLVPVSELGDSLGLEMPETDAVTLGGLVTDLFGRIPNVGDEGIGGQLRFTVLEMDHYRVARVKVEAHPDRPGTVGDDALREES